MDLETAKLVAFALWAEASEGVTGKNPELLCDVFRLFQQMDTEGGVRAGLGKELQYKWDNYLTVWEASVEEAPAPTEREQVEAVEEKEELRVEGIFTGRASPQEEGGGPEKPAEEKPKPKEKRGKRG